MKASGVYSTKLLPWRVNNTALPSACTMPKNCAAPTLPLQKLDGAPEELPPEEAPEEELAGLLAVNEPQ